MFKFITGKPLWANILFSVLIVFIILCLFLLSLNFITKHGDTLTIPDVTGKSYDEAKKLLEKNGFEVELQDSVYNDTAAALAVLRQFPEPESEVKVNRTVYLTINRAVPPSIDMPNLEGLSFRSAEMVIKQYGLKLQDTVYRPDFAKNSVLEQQVKGDRIKPGTKIPMGSSVVLVLGSGLGQDEFAVPDLFGMTYSEVKILLESNGLSVGVVIPRNDVQDTLNAFVYQQRPDRVIGGRMTRIRQGQSIDIFLQREKPVRETDSTALQSQNDY